MMEEMQQDKVISEDFSLAGQLPYKSLPAQNQALKTGVLLWNHSGTCKAGESRLCKSHLLCSSACMFSNLALVCLGLFMLSFRISPDVGCSQITAGLCDLEELVRRHSSCCFYRKESDGRTSVMWKGSACSSLRFSQAAQDNPKPLLGETLQSSVLSKRHLGSSNS